MNSEPGDPQIQVDIDAAPRLSVPEPGSHMIPVDVVTMLPYPLARRLKALIVEATPDQVTVLMGDEGDVDARVEIESVTGRTVHAIKATVDEIDNRLDRLSGTLESDDLWLQRRHIHSLSRLVDHAVNVGQIASVRSLVDRALEFAPYSEELWLSKARVSAQRVDVVHALTVASQTAPNDRRVLRWIHSLQDLEDEVTPATEDPGEALAPPDQDQVQPMMISQPGAGSEGLVGGLDEPADSSEPSESKDGADTMLSSVDSHTDLSPEDQPDKADAEALSNHILLPAIEAARDIASAADLEALLSTTADALQTLSGADSVSVFFRAGRVWHRWSTDPALRPRLGHALPKENRLAAQAMKQGLPIVIADTNSRSEDVGQFVLDAGIASFALLPIAGPLGHKGLAYLNFREVDRSSAVFDEDLGRAVDVVLNCAGAAAAALASAHSMPETAVLDSLTESYAFPQFQRLLEAEVERARRYRFSVALLSIDIDDFGSFRERYGVEAADGVLQSVAGAIRSIQRVSDVLSRRDEDQFLVMLPQTTCRGAQVVAGRIQNALGRSYDESEESTYVSVSIGAAAYPEQADDAATVLDAANIALFRAKAEGKDRTVVADTLSLGA